MNVAPEVIKLFGAKRRFFSVEYKFLCVGLSQIAEHFNRPQRFDVAKVPREPLYRMKNVAFAVY